MSIAERKNKFIEQFIQIDDENRIKQFEDLLDQEIVSYTVQGKPLNRAEYKAVILGAEQNGNYTSVEDLEKQVESW
jgi:hypothetical protein